MSDERRTDWQLIDDALRAVEVHRRPADRPRFRRLTFALFVLLLAVTLGIAWSVWR